MDPYDKSDHAKYHWKFDPHWNIGGNAPMGDLIYRYLQMAEPRGLHKPEGSE